MIDINGIIYRIKCNVGFGYKDIIKIVGLRRKIVINLRIVNVLKKIMLENKKM